MSLFVTLPAVSMLIGIFHIGKLCFQVPCFKKLLLRNHVVDFVEIYNVCTRKTIVEAAKRRINSGKVCRSYSDLDFGGTFLEHSVFYIISHVYTLHPQSSDPVLVVYQSSKALGYLTQPSATGSSLYCRDSNPVGN